jgi:hypothetical protein
MNAAVGSIATPIGLEPALYGDDRNCVNAPLLALMAKAETLCDLPLVT